MTIIPTKAEIARIQANRSSKKSKRRKDTSFEEFKIAILRSMIFGNSSYWQAMSKVVPSVQARLQAEFGPEWTLDFQNVRTGCTIHWS